MALRTLACLLLLIGMAPAAQQPQPKPLNKEQVSAMVRDGLADEFGARLVKDRGIDFAADQDFLDSLRKGGANDAFIKGVQEASRPAAAPSAAKPLNRVQLASLVRSGIPDSRIATLLGERGVDFEPTDGFLQQLRTAGAGQETLDALNAAVKVKPAGGATSPALQPESTKGKPPASSAKANVRRIRVGGAVEAAMLVYQEKPDYPQLARMARIQGTVRMETIIDKDGTVEDVKVISGHPLLIESALMAVSRWRYRPTLLNGQPVEVLTEVDVNFTLAQ